MSEDSLTKEELERFDKIVPLLIYGDRLVEAQEEVAHLKALLHTAYQKSGQAWNWPEDQWLKALEAGTR